MAEVTIVVCDVCGSLDRHTSRYRIGRGQESSHFDLCEEHAGPVDDVIATKGPDGGALLRAVGQGGAADLDETVRSIAPNPFSRKK